MKLSKVKIEVAMANKNMTLGDVAEKYGASKERVGVIKNSCNVTPKTAGRLADALGVDVTEIIE